MELRIRQAAIFLKVHSLEGKAQGQTENNELKMIPFSERDNFRYGGYVMNLLFGFFAEVCLFSFIYHEQSVVN
jgi:hypothetical protein